MSHFFDGEEGFMWVESNEKSNSPRFDASRGSYLLMYGEVMGLDEDKVWILSKARAGRNEVSSPCFSRNFLYLVMNQNSLNTSDEIEF